MNTDTQLHFFLGANTPVGFVSWFDEIAGGEEGLQILFKGGPGTGKSTAMKEAYARFSPDEPFAEKIHCSSDPDSLDAVVLPRARIVFLDATPPHAREARYPGVLEETVDFSRAFDREKLAENREEILSLYHRIAACHQQCIRFLSAAHALLCDNCVAALAVTDTAKIKRVAAGIAGRECKLKKTRNGKEKKRLLSAVTPKGLICFTGTIRALCPRIYLIKDPYGAASGLLLTALRSAFSEYGLTLYTCPDPLNPYSQLEHLLLPELGLGFVTVGRGVKAEDFPDAYRTVSFTRFTDTEALKKHRQRLRFNRRAAGELLDAAVRSLKKAKYLHDALEEFYGKAIDFKKAGAMADEALALADAFRGQAEENPLP